MFHDAFSGWTPEHEDRQAILVGLVKDDLLAEVYGSLEVTDAGRAHLQPLLDPL